MQMLFSLSQMRTPFLEQLFSWVTRCGEETVAVLLLCTLFWCVDKKLGYGLAISFFISGLLVNGLKIHFRIERPWVRDPSFHPSASAVEKATGYSFPSGHTQAAASLYVPLGLRCRNAAARIALLLLPVAVAFSRMFLGVHTWQDVSVSLVLSAGIAIAVTRMHVDYTLPRVAWGVSGVLSLTSVVLLGYALFLHGRGVLPETEMNDAFKMAGSGIGFAMGYVLETRYIRFSERTSAWWMQGVKLAIGLGVAMALKSGLKLLLGESPAAGAARYVLVILWIIALWPWIFSRFLKQSSAASVQA